MDFVRFGRIARTLRIRRGWRQSDLGARARVGRAAVSMVERGRARELRLDLVVRIIEETEIVDINELMGTADRKRRLAAEIGRERGWHPLVVATWLIVADSKTNRRRVAAHGTILRSVYPADGRSINSWLRDPAGSVACLNLATVKRVRTTHRAAA